MFKKLFHNFYLKDKLGFIILAIIAVGTIAWSLTMVKNGMCWTVDCANGRQFWGPNGHDGIWHIAVSESFSRGSLNMPVFAGEVLKNYHIGFALLLSFLHRLTAIPSLVLYFQVLPPILGLLAGVFVYKFVFAWTKSKSAAAWVLFFTYFGGSFGYLISLARDGNISGESAFWSQQAISTLVNPPFALSLVIMFCGFWFLEKGLKKEDKVDLTVASVLFGVLVQVKIYSGILSLAALLAAALWMMYKKKGLLLFKVFLTSFVLSVVLFPSVNFNQSGGIVFKPFWFLETMMQVSDRVGWQKFGEAMVAYKTGHVYIKLVASYFVAFLIFLLGNLGTRVISILYVVRKLKLKEVGYIDLAISTVIVLGIIVPTFFVQEGTPWNTIQFLYYSLAFSAVYAGVYLAEHTSHWPIITKKIVFSLVVLLTLPTTFGTLYYVYLPQRPPSYVSKEELEGLHFLADRPAGVVLTYPFDRFKAEQAIKNPPRPLYLYESTAYVSALSRHDVFLEDEVNLDITGYNWRERRRALEDWYNEGDASKAKEFLSKNNIKYVYWIKEKYDDISQRAFLGSTQLGLTNIYENSKVIIYKTF